MCRNQFKQIVKYNHFSIGALLCVFLFQCTSLNASTTNDGVFTLEQAAAGRDIYRQDCASCHGSNLDGGELGTTLIGKTFRVKWQGRPLQDLMEIMSTTMPLGNPGGLSSSQYTRLLTYMQVVMDRIWMAVSLELH